MATMYIGMIIYGDVPPPTHRHKLAGVVTIDGVPAKRVVAVLRRTNFSLLAMVISFENTGVWELSGLPEYPERSLLILSLDNTGNYNSIIADYISQVAG